MANAVATTENVPIMTYEAMRDHHNNTEELPYVKLRQDFDDGTYVTERITKATNASGLITLTQDTIPEFLDKAENVLHYDGSERYNKFSDALGSNLKTTWNSIKNGRPENQRTTANFLQDLFELIKQESGDATFDQTQKEYLLHTHSSYRLTKPKSVSPQDHSKIMRALINTFNSIPTVAPLTEKEIRSSHYKSYPAIWRESYNKSHDEIPDIQRLTASMQSFFNDEVSHRVRNGSRNRQGRKRSNSNSNSNNGDSNARHNNSQSTGVSNQGYRNNRGQSQPHGGRGKRPRGGNSNGNDRRTRGPNDAAACPIHCAGMSADNCSHTWYYCKLNPRGPNYEGDARTSSRNNATQNYYNDQGSQQQQSAAARGDSRGRGHTSAERQFGNASTQDRLWRASNNDQHYLDMFGLAE